MVDYALLIFLFGLSFIGAFLLTPLLRIGALKNGIIAVPDDRKIHRQPVPYLGGVAIYCPFVLGIFIAACCWPQAMGQLSDQLKGLIIGGTLIVLLGLWDDIKNIRAYTKLFGQILVAVILFAYGFRIEEVTNPLFGGKFEVPFLLSMVLSILWFIGLMNAMNLIDGLDGLAAGIVAIVCGALLVIAQHLNNSLNMVLLVILMGATTGFLRFNFYPAKIFLGDAGSMFLGLVIGAIALIGSQHKSATAVVLLTPLTALTIPIYDTFIAIVRRISSKGSVFVADKRHLHHRLLDIGLTQKQIVLFIYLVTLYLGIFAFLFVLIPERYALILLILLTLGVFMGARTVAFIERKHRLILRLSERKKKHQG